MKIKKRDLIEIINDDGNLIGNDDIPSVDANADTQAKNTTDTNQKVGQQPFRYDMLGRFGFTLMPFMEGEDKGDGQVGLENELTDLINDKFVDFISYYKQNPKKIISDYRKHVIDGEIGGDMLESSKQLVNMILKIVEKYFEKSFKNLDEHTMENIAENIVDEDKMVSKENEKMLSKRDDNGLKSEKLKGIAGFINKLNKKDIDELINLIDKNDKE